MKKLIPITLILLFYGFDLPAYSGLDRMNAATTEISTFKSMTEEEKVAHLINYIRMLKGAVFIRNGNEYSPGEAADHLKSKWNKHKKKVKTAQGFVTKLATKSMTDDPYLIKFSDGKTVKCGDLLALELKKIEH